MRVGIRLLIGFVFIGNLAFSQATTEYKTYHDKWETKIYSIEQKTDLGQLHGLQKYYDENGHLRESAMYKLGKREGSRKQYFASGKLAEEHNYVQDVEHGAFKIWGYEGEVYYLYMTGTKDNGILLKEETFHPNGKKASIYNYTGSTITWYPNGQKSAELNKVKDVTNGAFNTWYEDGTKMLEANYVNGREEGIWKYYGTGGNVIRLEDWTNGKRSGKWKYYHTYDYERVVQIESLGEATNYIEVDHTKVLIDDERGKEYYEAKGYMVDDTMMWEGYIIWSPVQVRDSDFYNWIQIGPMKYYEESQLVAEGERILLDANTSQIRSDRHGEWKYYENGKLYYIEEYNKGSVTGGREVK